MTELKAGDKAPDFKGMDQDGNEVALRDFSGKKLALYFYPKDNTPGCTKQACNIRDNYELLNEKGVSILGVSPDSQKKHGNFISKFDLPFPLLADTDKVVIEAYGVWGPKKFMGRKYDGLHRTTFLIDENGTIVDVIKKVKTKDHSNQILEGFKIGE